MLKIDERKMQLLSDFQNEELVYPFLDGKKRVFGYRTFSDENLILIGAYYTDGLPKGKYGGHVFFQRENLKAVIQAMEDWLYEKFEIRPEQSEIFVNGDEFAVSLSFPDRYVDIPLFNLANAREAEIDDYEKQVWAINTSIETGRKLLEELKQILQSEETKRISAS